MTEPWAAQLTITDRPRLTFEALHALRSAIDGALLSSSSSTKRLYRSTELYNFFYPNRSWYTKALRCAVEEYTAKAKLFDTWWHKHADSPIKAAELGHGRRILRL